MSALGTSQDSGCDSMPNSGAIVSKTLASLYLCIMKVYIYTYMEESSQSLFVLL